MRIGTPGAMCGGMGVLSGVNTQLLGANGLSIPAPLAFFRMEGSSGAGETDTVSSLTLSNNGTVGSAAGSKGNCRGAFGTNNYLNGANNAAYQMAGDWTMGFWFKAGAAGASLPIISKTGVTNFPPFLWEWTVSQRSDNFFGWAGSPNGNTTTACVSTGNQVSTSVFRCLICSYTVSDLKLRVSVDAGTEAVSTAMSGSAHTDTSDLWIGREHFNFDAWGTGYVDALAFWNVILTGAQRTAFYNSGTAAEYVAGVWA